MTNDPKQPSSGERESPEPAPEAIPESTPEQPAPEKRSGRVTFDARGNSVWEWQLETGVYSRDVSTQKLKKLDLGTLSIAETAIQKRPEGLLDPDEPKLPGSGFNPYDNTPRSEHGGNPYDNARIRSNALAPKPKTEPPKRNADDMRKLSDWIKLKKSVDKDRGK